LGRSTKDPSERIFTGPASAECFESEGYAQFPGESSPRLTRDAIISLSEIAGWQMSECGAKKFPGNLAALTGCPGNVHESCLALTPMFSLSFPPYRTWFS
jgi:hypothetical protein